MKKPYQKPCVYAESFELLEHIASCKANQDITTVTYRDRASCSYTDANVSLFNIGVEGCTNEYYEEGLGSLYDDFEDYIGSYLMSRGGCYNAFTDGNFFAS